MKTFDVVIVGGGPAGMSAALILGRCCRSVLVVDAGRPRNRFATRVHGYYTRDNTPPAELRQLGREQIECYGVEIIDGEVLTAEPNADGFVLSMQDDTEISCRKLLIATGVEDFLPNIEGISEYYGTSIHHCPYCDGWEWRGKNIAIYGRGESGAALSKKLRNWSEHVTLLTDGEPFDAEFESELAPLGIVVRTEKIHGLSGEGGKLQCIRLSTDDEKCDVRAEALFFTTGQRKHCQLAIDLGCAVEESGAIATDKKQATRIPNVFVAGDVSHDMQFVIVAAAEGAKAAVAISEELITEGIFAEPLKRSES